MTRRTLTLWLAAALFALPFGARAGVIIHVNDPFAEMDCGERDVVEQIMPSPTGFFGGLDDCKSLCKKAESECKTLTKQVHACLATAAKGKAAIAKRDCSQGQTDKDLIKACQDDVATALKSDTNELKVSLDSNSAACKQWSLTCQLCTTQ
jgi:hypothetical protein